MQVSASVGRVVFGQHQVLQTQVFYRSPLCYGLVNLMPIVPGHVMLVPRRRVLRYKDLTPNEISDMFISAQTVGKVVEREFGATALTFALQDGKDAGQTVEHVHLHIIPRKPNDFHHNDQVYIEIEKPERNKRTEEEMAKEAAYLSQFFPDNDKYPL